MLLTKSGLVDKYVVNALSLHAVRYLSLTGSCDPPPFRPASCLTPRRTAKLAQSSLDSRNYSGIYQSHHSSASERWPTKPPSQASFVTFSPGAGPQQVHAAHLDVRKADLCDCRNAVVLSAVASRLCGQISALAPRVCSPHVAMGLPQCILVPSLPQLNDALAPNHPHDVTEKELSTVDSQHGHSDRSAATQPYTHQAPRHCVFLHRKEFGIGRDWKFPAAICATVALLWDWTRWATEIRSDRPAFAPHVHE
ncbi:uncharacterized protein [Paramormyrops kingsleyae]|uniref:uncharacterized protein n=1 Tax=Paramormyrops kingsleyae TaxID=1676925 RepID=UPI003B96E03E